MSIDSPTFGINPFSEEDEDRHAIWEMLMRRDFEAFVVGDWSIVGNDFWEDAFVGVNAERKHNPDNWRLTFPSLSAYRDEWLRQVREFSAVELRGLSVLEFLYSACQLADIEINGLRAVAHKKFDGQAVTTSGERVVLKFQSLYLLAKHMERWVILGFVGYLPNPMLDLETDRGSGTPW